MSTQRIPLSVRTQVLLIAISAALLPLLLITFSSQVGMGSALWDGERAGMKDFTSPAGDVMALIAEHAQRLLPVLAVTLIMVYFGGLYVSRRMSKSLVEAAKAAQRVSLGDLDAVVPEEGPREVRLVAGAFNRMIQELRQHRHRLEVIVAERTENLRDSQRRLEQLTAHLKAAYESMIDGILVVEWPSGKVIAANGRFTNFFGLSPDDLQGKTCPEVSDAIRGSLAERAGDPFSWESLQQNEEQTTTGEWNIEQPVALTLSVYTAPVRSPSGQIFARLWMFRDLTQQRVLEDELRQAHKMEAVGRLAGGIAHDFNNLLTGILSNLSMAEAEVAGDGKAAELIGVAMQAARRASELVRQLLGFSRRSRLQLVRCDANALVCEVERLLRHSVDPRIEIRLELETELWGVLVDTTQLQQVLMNLCVNALDAMPNGGRLTLATHNLRVGKEEAIQWLEAKPGDYVRILVVDRGHGMTPEVQSHLYEPFFTTKAPGKGTGLGLAMSYGIVKQHGGWITCYSELNQGSTFGVYLPRTRTATQHESPEARPVHVKGGRERVLIVDDELAVRSAIQSILKKYGYTGIAAAGGEEAIGILSRDKSAVDLVVLDLTMPKLSGRDTFRGIRELAPDLPVIISSGCPVDASAFEKETGLKNDGFVQKPYEAAALARALREVLDASRPSYPA
jgi:two-component system, cell cycle sensor histidine kinase and response regulator CckA